MAVSKLTIVEASIRILNRDGIEGLTMRTIAKELNIKAASLYNHLRSRQELFAEIAEYMVERSPMPDSGGAPYDFLVQTSRAYRDMLKTVRDSVAIFEKSMPSTPRRVDIIRNLSKKLLEFGVLPENLMTISNMLNNYTLSFTADEVRFKNTPPELLGAVSRFFESGGNPIITGEVDFDAQFLYGLEVLFAGVKSLTGAKVRRKNMHRAAGVPINKMSLWTLIMSL